MASDEEIAVEAEATRVVKLIEKFIECLRSIKEFAPTKLSNGKDNTKDVSQVKLYTRLHENGLLSEIDETCRAAMCHAPDDQESVWVIHIHSKAKSEGERYVLVHKVILPLLQALGRCYATLDRIPNPTKQQGGSSRSKRSNAPPPPVGMLSIQHYTNVASLLEFLVCTSILPLLDRNVLTSAHDRSLYMLPRSLAGRLPRKSLLWGSSQTMVKDIYKRRQELQQVGTVLGNLVLLDRFRPMLLPRHLPDVYAAIFQVEALQRKLSESSDFFNSFTRLRSCLLSDPIDDSRNFVVDSTLQAQAFQSLLLQGTKAPAWLRQRVSKLLAALATQDLSAVVQVFVYAAPKDRSSACVRLARALVTKEQSDEYYRLICDQLFVLLDTVVMENISIQSLQVEGLTAQHATKINVVWAVLDQFPDWMLDEYIVERLNPMKVDTEASTSVNFAVRRIGVLLSSVPTSSNPARVCRLTLSALTVPRMEDCGDGPNPNLLNVLLSIASMPSVIKSKAKGDAAWTLRALVHIMSTAQFETVEEGRAADGVDVAAMALVYSLGPSRIELSGYRFASDGTNIDSNAENLKFERTSIDGDGIVQAIAEDVERRATFVVRELLLPLAAQSEDKAIGSITKTARMLPSRILQVLLTIYFSIGLSGDECVACGVSESPKLFRKELFQIVAMVALPILCEQCPPEAILFGIDASGIFEIMEIVFKAASARYGSMSSTTGNSLRARRNEEKIAEVLDCSVSSFGAADTLLASLIRVCEKGNAKKDESSFDTKEDEMLLSICSLLLTLLVGMLELGTEERTNKEESMLKSFVPSLRHLSESPSEAGGNFSAEQSEVAEIASHAMALIVSRGASPSAGATENRSRDERTQEEIFLEELSQAEQDLKSIEPPLRARGVVTLRHLASAVKERAKDESCRSSLILEDESLSHSEMLSRILSLSADALCDPESYVYLAAIQTIVAVVDAKPSRFVRAIGRAVSIGFLTLTEEVEEKLSSEQRIKIAEALIFWIRRRATVYEYLQVLVDLLLFGGRKRPSYGTSTIEQAERIRIKTHEYFLKGSDAENTEQLTDEDRWEEIDARVKAGGPLFEPEEEDVVRAARINVVAELLSAAHPSLFASYCDALIRCAVDTLGLDTSRPTRRAGALLVRELYGSLVREQDEMLESLIESIELPCPMAMAMVAADEELLYAALERCIEGKDIADLEEGKGRQFDPATVARCKEALELRREAEEGGILVNARILVASNRNGKDKAVAKMLVDSKEETIPGRMLKDISKVKTTEEV